MVFCILLFMNLILLRSDWIFYEYLFGGISRFAPKLLLSVNYWEHLQIQLFLIFFQSNKKNLIWFRTISTEIIETLIMVLQN